MRKIINMLKKFQSTLPRGSDRLVTMLLTGYLNFNPRSLAGATSKSLPMPSANLLFQSTLPRGSDLRRRQFI